MKALAEQNPRQRIGEISQTLAGTISRISNALMENVKVKNPYEWILHKLCESQRSQYLKAYLMLYLRNSNE